MDVGVLLLLSVLLRLSSPRVISYTSDHIDMDLVAEPFVMALERTKNPPAPGAPEAPKGIPFVAAAQGSTSASSNIVVIVASTMIALVSSCCLSGLAVQYWLTWHNNRNLDRFRADVKKIHEESVAESNKRAEALAKQNASSFRPPVSPFVPPAFVPPPFGPGGFPPFAPFPPGAEASAFPPGMPPGMMPCMPPGMPPGMAPGMPGMPGSALPPTRTSSSSVPRGETREQFFPRGAERVPPNSREIRDTAELATGAEVWALKGPTWYRAVVLHAESPFITRVHYYGWSAIHDSPIPASMIRIAEDRAGSEPARPVATTPVIDAPPRSDVPSRTSRSRSSRSSTPAPVTEEQTPPSSITLSPSLPTSPAPASASRRRTWSDTTGQFQVEATFVRLSSGMVTLRREDDQDIEIPLHRLSDEDRKIAEEMTKNK